MVAAALGTIGRERRGPRVRPKHAHPDPSRASCSYRAACVAGAKRISEDRRDKRPSSQHSRPRARSAPPPDREGRRRDRGEDARGVHRHHRAQGASGRTLSNPTVSKD